MGKKQGNQKETERKVWSTSVFNMLWNAFTKGPSSLFSQVDQNHFVNIYMQKEKYKRERERGEKKEKQERKVIAVMEILLLSVLGLC